MNLSKKLLLVLCLAVFAQPAYGWSWSGIAPSITKFITSSVPSFISENKALSIAVCLGVVALTANYAYGRYSESKKAEEARKTEEERKKRETEQAARKAQEEIERKSLEKKIEAEQKKIQEEERKKEAARQEAERKLAEEQKIREEEEKLRLEEERKRREAEEEAKLKAQKEQQILAQEAERRAQEERERLEKIEAEPRNSDAKKDGSSDFMENKENLSKDLAKVKKWGPLSLLDESSIENYFSFSGFHSKCLPMTELSKLIKGSSDYRDLIRLGAKLVWDLLYANNLEDNFKKYGAMGYNFYTNAEDQSCRHAYLADIIRVCWFMYSLALQKNEGFQEGSFIVHDKEDRIFNFLLNYVKRIDSANWNKGPVNITYNPYGCCRASTHITECQKKGYKHYGIDIRFGSEIRKLTLRSAILPAGKTHILFGKVDEDCTFIKMENEGLYYQDGWKQHVKGVISSIGYKIPGFIKFFVSWLFGSDDAPTNQLNDFAQMAKTLEKKIKTIGDIVEVCRENPVVYYTFMEEIIKKYPLYYKDFIGKEVILDVYDLKCSYFYQEKATDDHKNLIRNFVSIRDLLKWFADADSKDEISALRIQELVGSLKQFPKELSELEAFIASNEILKSALQFEVN